jgi:uncharacterized protein
MDEKLSLPYKLLPELAELASTKELSGKLPYGQLTRGSQVFDLSDGISYDLVLTNTGGGVLLAGSACTAGTTVCARCLEDAEFEVEGEVEGYFILNPDTRDVELSDDEFVIVGTDGVVDLAVPIVAAVIFELPQVLFCKEDCAGLCPVCGANLNEQQCGCADKPSPDHPFAVLGQLRDGYWSEGR